MSTFQNRLQNGSEHLETKSNLDLPTPGLISSLDNGLKSYVERTNQPSYYPFQNQNTSQHKIEEQQTSRARSTVQSDKKSKRPRRETKEDLEDDDDENGSSDSSISPSEPKDKKRLVRKRQIVKQSEQKRRDRINDCLSELEIIVPRHSSKHKKTTKETILLDTIEYIKQLQVDLKNTKTNSNLIDPFNTQPLTKDEINAGFKPLFTLELQRLHKITSADELHFASDGVHRIFELAERSGEDEKRLYAGMLQCLFYSTVTKNPKLMIKAAESVLPIYNRLRSINGTTVLPLFGTDIGSMVTMLYANSLAVLGFFDKASSYFKRSMELAKSLYGSSSLETVFAGIHMFKFLTDEIVSIQEATQIKQLLSVSKNSIWKPFGDLAMSVALAYYGNSNDIEEANIMLVQSVDSILSTFGTLGEMHNRGLALCAFKKLDPDTGLLHAEDLIGKCERRGITGGLSKSDYYRMKGELLLSKQYKTIQERELAFCEAKRSFDEAVTIAIEKELTVPCLRAMLWSGRLAQIRGEYAELQTIVIKLNELLNSILKYNVERPKIVVDVIDFLNGLNPPVPPTGPATQFWL